MTPSDVIAQARLLAHDIVAPTRYSDTQLLSLVNNTLYRIANFRPDLFATVVEHPLVVGKELQTGPSSAFRVMDVFRVVGGPAVVEVVRPTSSQSTPQWPDAKGTPRSWMRHARNPLKFFVYPAPISHCLLEMEVAAVAPAANMNSVLPLPNVYLPAMVDGVMYLAQTMDSEHVETQRAAIFYQSFLRLLSGSLESRVLTDTESAAVGLPTGGERANVR